MIRVLLADDHHLVRQALRALLETSVGIEVVGEAEDGHDAVRAVRRLQPDVVVMDIAMPRMNGLDAAEAIANLPANTRVVILSMHDDPVLIRRALESGVRGYLLKSSISAELSRAVRAAFEGRLFLSEAIKSDVTAPHKGDQAVDVFRMLTPREREVLQWVTEGRTNREVAGVLGISTKTVEKHRASLMLKLGVHDVPGLVRLAMKHRLFIASDEQILPDTAMDNDGSQPTDHGSHKDSGQQASSPSR